VRQRPELSAFGRQQPGPASTGPSCGPAATLRAANRPNAACCAGTVARDAATLRRLAVEEGESLAEAGRVFDSSLIVVGRVTVDPLRE